MALRAHQMVDSNDEQIDCCDDDVDHRYLKGGGMEIVDAGEGKMG